MSYGTIAATVVESSSSDGTFTKVFLTVLVLAILGLAFPAAQAWADSHDENGDAVPAEGKRSNNETLSLRPQWVLRQGKKVIDSFDDETEASREFVRRITTGATTT